MKLSEIHVYPIKSLRGVAVARARALPAGLEHDRRWMLVDEGGRFYSQREDVRLALVDVALVEDGYRVTIGAEAWVVPQAHAGPRVPVRVWDSQTEGVVHEEGSAWFSARLCRTLRLVHLPDEVVRAVEEPGRAEDRVSFADAFPYLLLGQASLDHLQARSSGPPLAMTRFRPNLVVAGSEPHAEDGWVRLRIGEVGFRGMKRCDRCVMTTIDPATGDKGVEPLQTLASYRREGAKVWFGAYLVAEAHGWLCVGDEVVVEDGGA